MLPKNANRSASKARVRLIVTKQVIGAEAMEADSPYDTVDGISGEVQAQPALEYRSKNETAAASACLETPPKVTAPMTAEFTYAMTQETANHAKKSSEANGSANGIEDHPPNLDTEYVADYGQLFFQRLPSLVSRSHLEDTCTYSRPQIQACNVTVHIRMVFSCADAC